MSEQTLVFPVQGVTCMGCVNTLTRVIGALPGVAHVDVDKATGRTEVRVADGAADRAAIVQAIEEAGYDVG